MSTGIQGTRRATGARRLRGSAVALIASLAIVGGACAPQTPPAGGGGIGIDFGPLTIPLPPIELRPPATTIPVLGGLCNIGYQPPGVQVRGATVTIPGVRVDPANPIITVPNVVVNIPQLRLPLSTIGINCGLLNISTQVDLIVPSTVVVRAATLNLQARTITLTNPSFTVNGAGIGIPGLGDLIVPLPPIVNVPLPSGAISF